MVKAENLMVDMLKEKQKETAKKIIALLGGCTVEEAETILHSVGDDLKRIAKVTDSSKR